ncbi:MAG: hypothetical protein KAR21_24695, partial [Spirochaetales bacterium]|nr:hypothetical protein [Spirochaetales bacterium]
MTSKPIYILLIIYFFSSFVQVSETDEFTISFEPIIMKGIDTNYLHFANSIPEMLFYELQNASMHLYSENEIAFLKDRYVESNRKEHLLKLSEFIEEYNTYIFLKDFQQDVYVSLGEKIESEQEILDNFEDIDIPVPESSVPIKFIIDKASLNIIDSKKSELSDLVIKGSMEKLDEWIYLQIWIENNILGTEELLYESISSPDTIPELIPEIISKLKTVVLGRPWASIGFELVPEDSNIFITHGNEQVLHQSFQYLYPGVYDIEIKTPGYLSEYIKVDLEAYDTRIIPVSLEEKKRITISVQSFPAGADLYSGATWVGKTPLLMKNPIIPALLTFKLEGYNDNKIVYKDKDNRDLQIFMQSEIINIDKIISSKREKF